MSGIPMVEQWYRALSDGRLLIQRCQSCGKYIMYPKYRCPSCFDDDLRFEAAMGSGTLQSWTVTRIGSPSGFEADLPYGLGVVRLEEGVQLLGRLRADPDGDWSSYRCDLPVVMVPPPAGGRTTVWFAPADSMEEAQR